MSTHHDPPDMGTEDVELSDNAARMAEAVPDSPVPEYDTDAEQTDAPPLVPVVGHELVTGDDLRQQGRELQRRFPVEDLDHSPRGANRPSIEEFVRATNEGRLEHLLPLRLHKMLASPFAFYRGAAALMTADLADSPHTGLSATLCGDAHAANFGLYGARDGRVIMDINDFDEAHPGPWEWDLKRLAASLVLAGREGGATEKQAAKAAKHAAKSYRKVVRRLSAMPFVESWNAAVDADELEDLDADDLYEDFQRALAKATNNTSEKVVRKSVETIDDHEYGIRHHRFVPDPPKLTPVSSDLAHDVREAVRAYVPTTRESRHQLLARYAMSDVAFRVVGTGSVGTQSYIVLLHGNDEEFLVLQVKEARPSVLSPYVENETFDHEGERVVRYARRVQSDTDFLMGWTTMRDRHFMVRQFRNYKGDLDPTTLDAQLLDDYGRLAGALLAKGHCRTLHPDLLAGYLEVGKEFDKAIKRFAVRYADQTEEDYAEFRRLVDDGTFEASALD